MNTKTSILIKTDKKVKAAAQKAAKDVGIPLSTILNAYLRQFAHERKVEFSAPMPKPSVGRSLLKASEDYRKGKNISPGFTSGKDAITWLRKQR